MFIAHLPAGYLLVRTVPEERRDRAGLMAVLMIASVTPDLDLLWFYLVDNRQTVHHAYILHWPLFWLGLALIGMALSWVAKAPRIRPFIWAALAGTMLHMALDSIAATIGWVQPFSDLEIGLVEVPAGRD